MKGELCMLKYVQASTQLQTFQYLKARMEFIPEQNKTYNQLYKGYLGERKFSAILDKRLTKNCIILFEFTLYNAPQHPSIILPTQINRFVQRLNRISSNMDYRHRKLANQLITSHITKSPYEKLPEYQFSELNRGIFCKSCRSKMFELQPGKMHCQQCSYVESIDSALLRNVLEFNFLFPEKVITTSVIQEWSGIQRTSRTIRRILKRYLGYEPNYRHSYFYLENRTIKL